MTCRDLESNLSVDWSQLRPEDEAKLATHLTQEYRDWLDHATSQREDAEWEKHTEEDLRTVVRYLNVIPSVYCSSTSLVYTYRAHVLMRSWIEYRPTVTVCCRNVPWTLIVSFTVSRDDSVMV